MKILRQSLAIFLSSLAILTSFCPAQTKSKKGLQVEIVDDALKLGIKHAALNVNLSQLIVPNPNPNQKTATWTRKERTYHFNQNYLHGLDRKISPLSKNGVTVNLIILAYRSHNPAINQILLHPQSRPDAPNRLGAFNSVTVAGKQWLHACLEYLAHRYSLPKQPHGRVSGYVIGNEVNSHWWWANRGEVSMKDFADEYHDVVRIMHRGVRNQSADAKVYISLEHHWNIRYPAGNELKAFPGKPFVDYFAKIVKEKGDFDWHLAFHPYPENLRDPEFWKDATATNSPESKRITFKNLPVLTNYFKRPELLYQGKPRRIILSEQGFDTPKKPNGQKIQAAAYAYAYRIIDNLDGIDAFILHRHVDHPKEGGLRLGLRTLPPARDKKLIYDVFLHADRPDWKKHFAFALPIIGLTEWPGKSE